jgi:hypothetical protein
MIILDTITKTLEVILAGAITTTQLPFTVSYVDVNADFEVIAASELDGTTNSGTAVTMVPAPNATISRQIKFLSIPNVDTAAATVTVRLNNNTTTRIIWKGALAVGDVLTYVG